MLCVSKPTAPTAKTRKFPSKGPLLFPAYLVGATALTESREHGWHALDRRGLFVILRVRFGHAVTDVFGVCCCLNFDSFASLR